jgi:hypothetical protein
MSKFIGINDWIIDLEQISAVSSRQDSIQIYIRGIDKPISFSGKAAQELKGLMSKLLSPTNYTLSENDKPAIGAIAISGI